MRPPERKLPVLALSGDLRTRSYRCGATFPGRADRPNWRTRPLLERPNGFFIKESRDKGATEDCTHRIPDAPGAAKQKRNQ